jgi:hypothetical protein
MVKLRDEYESIFYDIEGTESDTKVEWPLAEQSNSLHQTVLCYPRFISKKDAAQFNKRQSKTTTSKSETLLNV